MNRILAALVCLFLLCRVALAQREPFQDIHDLGTIPTGGGVNAVAFQPGTKTLAVATGNLISLYDIETGKQSRRLEGHTTPVVALTYSADGALLASASDGEVRLWDTTTGALLRTIHSGISPTTIAISKSNKTVACAHSGDNHRVVLWAVATGQKTGLIAGMTHPVTALRFQDDRASLVAIGGGLNQIPQPAPGTPPPAPGLALPYYPAETEIAIISVAEGIVQHHFAFHPGGPNVAFTADGTYLAVVTTVAMPAPGFAADVSPIPVKDWMGTAVAVFRTPVGDVIGRAGAHREPLTLQSPAATPSIAWSADGKLLAIGEGVAPPNATAGLVMWNGGQKPTDQVHLGCNLKSCDTVAFSPGGHFLVAASRAGDLQVFELPPGVGLGGA